MTYEEKYKALRRAAILMAGIEDDQEKLKELAKQLVELGAATDPDGMVTLNLVRVLYQTEEVASDS